MNEYQCQLCGETTKADDKPAECQFCHSDDLMQICPMCSSVIDEDTGMCPICQEAVA